MLFFWKMRRNRGSFLIEVIASIVVMSIGLLTVMQVYASQRRLATMNEKQTQEGFVLADRLDAVLAGADVRALYGQDRADPVQIESKILRDDREGLIEKKLFLRDPDVRKRRMMAVTYVKGDDAAGSR